MIQKIKQSFQQIATILKESYRGNSFTPSYRVVEVTEKDKGEYIATIQVLNKHVVFHTKPEDILKDDKLVDQFSPRDIRTLTYLGYLGINSPKYTVLAKRLSENADKTLFALKEKGKKKIVTKSAQEIFSDNEMIKNLSATDAHEIGYTVATETITEEKRQKEQLKKQLGDKDQTGKQGA